jgi:pimeloyl-ACP methyl ester carboxylesterase
MHPDTPSDPPPEFVEYQGQKLAFTDEGKGPQVIVAVPGLPGSIRDFRWLAPALSTTFRIIRVELPGYGLSGRGGFQGMSIAERAEPVRELMNKLQIRSAQVLGHSSGGTIVAHLARHHPELVESCVFIAANGPEPHYQVRAYRALATLFNYGVGRAAMRPVLRRAYRALGFPAHLTDDELMFTTLDAAATDFSEHKKNLRAISQRSLVAWASDDNLIPPKVFEKLETAVPNGPRLRYAKGGHNLQKTRATEIANSMREFCG